MRCVSELFFPKPSTWDEHLERVIWRQSDIPADNESQAKTEPRGKALPACTRSNGIAF